jgi:RNA polymerase sigma factor (sigma-70 family)
MNDLRITVTIKNNLLLRAMEDAGFYSAAAFARACGCSYAALVEYLSLKRTPYLRDGSHRPSILLIADTLRRLPEDLFPPPFLHRALAKNSVVREVSSADMPALLAASDDAEGSNPERLSIVNEAVSELTSALDDLSPRERKCIAMLYGLDGHKTSTLDQVAATMGVTRERIRQIVLKGQRKLAHPNRNLRARCAGLLDAPT